MRGSPSEEELDGQVRLAAFAFLDNLKEQYGDTVPRSALVRGFEFRGVRVPLVGPQGIFKPAILPEVPLTITTAPITEGRARAYEDEWTGEGILYRYRGTDPNHHENVGLRKAMGRRIPLIYLAGIVPGQYLPAFPAYVVDDDPISLTFSIAMDEYLPDEGVEEPWEESALRREYITRLTRQRLHQVGFRQRVIHAYRETCAICRLRHSELLDAAHILPDTDPRSLPLVSNGLSLCRLHHAAFDRHVLGVRPDLRVEIRRDILEEANGPMLVHGLQGFHGARLLTPRRESMRPNRVFLEERYERFRQAG